ncbi:CAP10 domain-containing protein [Mycena venus]|uniref:CAP10 domain-containing protein n=1 Tax=Mycena venus TaxID=2733690 RepID=A0A8H6X788_9AGAR|nr:CAP10 domain-containing protein [Mycena venus]
MHRRQLRPSPRALYGWLHQNSGYIFLGVVFLAFLRAGLHAAAPPAPPSPPSASSSGFAAKAKAWLRGPEIPHPIPLLMDAAEARYRTKLARQSTSLPAAVAEYTRRYSRPPPHGFDKWYAFAKERDFVMIDEFDTVYEDLQPFWELAGGGAEIRRRAALVGALPSIDLVRIRGGKAETIKGGDGRFKDSEVSARANGFKAMMGRFVKELPDMDFPINAKAEGRVVVPWEHVAYPNTTQDAATVLDPASFRPDWAGLGSVWDAWRRTCAPSAPARRLYSSVGAGASGVGGGRDRLADAWREGLLRAGASSASADASSVDYEENDTARVGRGAGPSGSTSKAKGGVKDKTSGAKTGAGGGGHPGVGSGADFAFIPETGAGEVDFCARPGAHYEQGHFFSDWRVLPALVPVFSPARGTRVRRHPRAEPLLLWWDEEVRFSHERVEEEDAFSRWLARFLPYLLLAFPIVPGPFFSPPIFPFIPSPSRSLSLISLIFSSFVLFVDSTNPLASYDRYTYAWDPINLEQRAVDAMEVPWEKKRDVVWWRGASTGGGSSPGGFGKGYQRHRFLRMSSVGLVPGTLADAQRTTAVTFAVPQLEQLPGVGEVQQPYSTDASASTATYTTVPVPLSALNADVMDTAFVKAVVPVGPEHRFGDSTELGVAWGYKYLLDLDGMGYSGRFMAFLASDSVPVKATVYDEFFTGWIEPWYVSVFPCFSLPSSRPTRPFLPFLFPRPPTTLLPPFPPPPAPSCFLAFRILTLTLPTGYTTSPSPRPTLRSTTSSRTFPAPRRPRCALPPLPTTAASAFRGSTYRAPGPIDDAPDDETGLGLGDGDADMEHDIAGASDPRLGAPVGEVKRPIGQVERRGVPSQRGVEKEKEKKAKEKRDVPASNQQLSVRECGAGGGRSEAEAHCARGEAVEADDWSDDRYGGYVVLPSSICLS